jgi:hypothetical protein
MDFCNQKEGFPTHNDKQGKSIHPSMAPSIFLVIHKDQSQEKP